MTRTYGQLARAKQARQWVMRCEPQVTIRVKRIFAKGDKGVPGGVSLADTVENCREILWLLERYPMEMSAADRGYLQRRATVHRKLERDVASMLGDDYQPGKYELALPPRDYQRIAADLLVRRGSLLLADDVGLGKTAVAICAMLAPNALPALVVTLAHLPRQWQAEIKKFAPALTSHVLRSGKPYELTKARGKKVPYPDVILSSYHKLSGWDQLLAGKVRTVVFDEAQELRHAGTGKYDAAKFLASKADLRLGLSVGPDTWIELQGRAFGRGWAGSIEAAFDHAVRSGAALKCAGAYEIVEASGVYGRGWTRAGGFGWQRLRHFIRHAAPARLLTLRVAGDHLVVTPDHSVFTISTGTLAATGADKIVVGDVVPVDDGRRWEMASEPLVDVASIVASMPKAQVAVDLCRTTRHELGMTSWQWQNSHREAKYGTRLPADLYAKHRDKLPPPTLVYFSQCKRPNPISAGFRLSDWAYLLGFFIGDGWLQPKGQRISFAVEAWREESFMSMLRALPHVVLAPVVRRMPGKSVEFRISHRAMAAVLLQAFGGAVRCYEKTIPGEWIVSWPHITRLQLLRGLIDSDGHLTRGRSQATYTTSSLSLARSLLSLLRSVGVLGNITPRKPVDGGVIRGRRIKSKRTSYQVTWSLHAMEGCNEGYLGARTYVAPFRDECRQGKVRSIATHATDVPFVYDVEMTDHPSFSAGGVLAHNSATPIYNYGGEIHNVLSVIAPDELGHSHEFMREWCNTQVGYGGQTKAIIKDPKALGHYLREQGLMLRRTRADVGRELPPITSVPHYVDADLAALDEIATPAAKLARIILAQGGSGFEKMRAAEELDWRLRQATGIGKARHVAAFVRLLVESGEPVVLYAWHREVYALLMESLGDLKPVMYTGSESVSEKERSKAAFLSGDSNVLIMSLRSGAGLDGLQERGRTVVFAELDWSPGVHEQCIGRLARDGQAGNVVAYYLLAETGSDPVIADTLGLKRQQIDGLRDPTAAVVQGAVDVDRVKKLAEAFLEQHSRTRSDQPDLFDLPVDKKRGAA